MVLTHIDENYSILLVSNLSIDKDHQGCKSVLMICVVGYLAWAVATSLVQNNYFSNGIAIKFIAVVNALASIATPQREFIAGISILGLKNKIPSKYKLWT
jgi:hypothetical protein